MVVRADQKDWLYRLPMTEFAINSSINSSHWVKISIFWDKIDKKYVQNINQVFYLLFCQI